jgi:hypothetical protein
LVDSYASPDFFLSFVAPWRPRLAALPQSPGEAENVEVEATRYPQGGSSLRLTYHHELPKNAITIVTSVWQGDVLVKLAFMKGFANVVLGPTPGSQGIWRGASRRGYSD